MFYGAPKACRTRDLFSSPPYIRTRLWCWYIYTLPALLHNARAAEIVVICWVYYPAAHPLFSAHVTKFHLKGARPRSFMAPPSEWPFSYITRPRSKRERGLEKYPFTRLISPFLRAPAPLYSLWMINTFEWEVIFFAVKKQWARGNVSTLCRAEMISLR